MPWVIILSAENIQTQDIELLDLEKIPIPQIYSWLISSTLKLPIFTLLLNNTGIWR